MLIEVICTGDEVLTGKIVNGNYAHVAQRLEDFGFEVRRGLTVGDDRAELLEAFRSAGERAEAVIVNGGLGPTVDDLSQEVAAQAAGVELELRSDWLEHMERFFRSRGRTMPENNRKQALLPRGAELLDNPVGTACGFAVRIGRARFFFTPGVPRELHRMLDEQIVPRLLREAGSPGVIVMRRFHSFGLGESHVDHLLTGVEQLDPTGSVKLGFRAHYPQLETKLVCRAPHRAAARQRLAPLEAEIYRRIGNFILSEDDETLEQAVQRLLADRGATLALVESLTGGRVAHRLAALPGAERVLLQGTVVLTPLAMQQSFALEPGLAEAPAPADAELALALARAARRRAGASHGLAVLGRYEGEPRGPARHVSGELHVALAAPEGEAQRRTRLTGPREWIGLGGTEMALDVLRRHLRGLPVDEKIDFERDRPQAAPAAGR